MAKTVIVETVTGQSMAEIRAARDASSAEMVELRLDHVSDPDAAGALEGRRVPVIVTCRASWEGGRFQGSEAERLRILQDAADRGAEFVDLEWKADRRAFAAGPSTQVVLSHHDFSGVPADLEDRVRAMAAEHADVVKVAVAGGRLRDCVRLRDAFPTDRRRVAIVMGPSGRLTRLCPWLMASEWTYGGTAAPGQLTVDELVSLYAGRSTTTKTAVYGVAGSPIGHSASPAMHNAAFASVGMDAVYVALETADADELLAVADAFGLAGASITAPLKQDVFAQVMVDDELTRRVRAVNTLRRAEAGQWEGRNYDVAGFLSPFDRRRTDLQGRRAVVLGTGGSARTAVVALRERGAVIEIAGRRPERATALAAELHVGVATWPPAPGWDVLVNTTPVGTWPNVDAAPLAQEYVRGGCVYDLIYNPPETRLLQWARQSGAETISGLEMLVGQACHQFRWWTGTEAPQQVMEQGARAFIAQANRRS